MNLEKEKVQIQQCHPGLELSELMNYLKGSACPILLNDSQQDELKLQNNPKRLDEFKNLLLNFTPTNFEEFIWLFKTTTLLFTISKSTDDSSFNLNLLRRTFKMNGKNWDTNPIHLHLLSKEIYDCLKYDLNRLYFARKISNISRMSLYISLCIVWAVFFKTLNIEVNMYRFHKFSEIIQHINAMDEKINENQLYILLGAISYLLNTITGIKIPTEINKRYRLYYEFQNEDLLSLREWCLKINNKYSRKVAADPDGGFNVNHAIISDIINLDILHFLEHIHPINLTDTDTELED